MTATLPPHQSPADVQTPRHSRVPTTFDDTGQQVYATIVGLLKRPRIRDLDFAERAAIAHTDDAIAHLRAGARKSLIWFLITVALVAMVGFPVVAAARDPWFQRLLVVAFVITVVIAAAVIALHRRNLPQSIILDRLHAGLCGCCATRLPRSPTPGKVTCSSCGHKWRTERIPAPSSLALADRRSRSNCDCWTTDARGVRAPLAAAFDGPWPTQHALHDLTSPSDRAPWARQLRRQYLLLRLLALCLCAIVAACLILLVYAPHISLSIAFVAYTCVSTVLILEAILVTRQSRPSTWLRQAAHAATRHWLSLWRCPCCDGDLATTGRWHLWGAASVLCERCLCVWRLHSLGHATLKAINRCGTCDYDLSGLSVGQDQAARCPECGTILLGAVILRCRDCTLTLRFTPQTHPHAVRCTSCGQTNDVRWSIPGSIRPQLVYADSATPAHAARTPTGPHAP